MVMNRASKGSNGLRDWVIQRVSAVFVAAYVIFFTGYFFLHADLNYLVWQNLFSMTAMRVFNLLVLLALVLHAWVGIWTISTDYLKTPFIRFSFQVIVLLILSSCLIWGVQIFWGV
jgi:succinate dehydrogenase / fumarate reductase membrane anchor subunit